MIVSLSSKITNEIAFQIGKGDYPRLYDTAIWTPNIEEFEYVHFFNWENPIKGRQENKESCMWVFYGSLKEDVFASLDLKKSYIKGALSSYAGKVAENSLIFNFANSFPTRDRIAKWINEILEDKFGREKKWLIKKSNNMSTIPAISTLNISGDSELISFLTSD